MLYCIAERPQDWTEKAREFWSDRIVTNRSSEAIKREQAALKKAVEDAEKRYVRPQGLSSFFSAKVFEQKISCLH